MYGFSSTHGFYSRGLDPDAVGFLLRDLSKDQPLTAGLVVDEARREESPLHPAFEWNNERAGEKFRLFQARSLIRAIVVKNNAQMPIPQYYHVVQHDGSSNYQPVEVVVRHKDLYESALEQLLQDLRSAERSVGALELAGRTARKKELIGKAAKIRKPIQEALAAAES